jgi:hypothetical protein
MTWTIQTGDWTQFRRLPELKEVDFHVDGPREVPYWEAMAEVERETLKALQDAQARGDRYVMFRHGWSTSRPGQMTVRSVIRRVMRSPCATPYIIRTSCVQHYSVFVAAIRPLTPKGSA